MDDTTKNKPDWKRLARKHLLRLIAAAGLAISTHAAAHTYTFAVVPQFEQRKLFAIWKPVVDELQKRTGHSFKLVATLTIKDFERKLSRGAFDFVYANPYHIMKVSHSQGYIPLVRDEEALRGVLVVRKDSPIQHISELEGKTVAFPSPNAIGASLLMRADLSRLYHVKVTPLYVKTHSSVYFHVVNGLTAAGGGVEKTLHEQDDSVQDALRVLYTTREMPSHPIAAHPRVSKTLRNKVQHALLEMGRTRDGLKLLDKVPMHKVVATSLEDYTPMRSWGLESLWVED